MMRICTIGYERAAFVDFAAALVAAGVTSVIDVRAAPHSRRREFAFKHLGPELAEYGIGYESWPELGTPAEGRAAAKRGDMAAFHRSFMDQLATPGARAALDALVDRAAGETPCLMCYERDPAHCHRSLIGERLLAEQSGLEIRDLFVDGPVAGRSSHGGGRRGWSGRYIARRGGQPLRVFMLAPLEARPDQGLVSGPGATSVRMRRAARVSCAPATLRQRAGSRDRGSRVERIRIGAYV